MSVVAYPGTKTTPLVLLNWMLDRAAEAKGMIVIELDSEGRVEVWTSCLQMDQLTWMAAHLQRHVMKTLDEPAQIFCDAPKEPA